MVQNLIIEYLIKAGAVLVFVIFTVMVCSCSDCAETTYTNTPYYPDEYKQINPYTGNQNYRFVSKSRSSNFYELSVLQREIIDWEYSRTIENNTHLGIGCKDYDPVEIYTTRFDRTVLKMNFLNTNTGRDNIGILIGKIFESETAFFNINTNYSPYPGDYGPGYQYLSGSTIKRDGNSLQLNYQKIDSVVIGNSQMNDLYKIDSMYTLYWENSEYLKDIYFLGALYSIEHGFVRFITAKNDTLDLLIE